MVLNGGGGGAAFVAFMHALARIGWTNEQRDALLYQGIDSLDRLNRLPATGVADLCKRMNKMPLPPDEPGEPPQVVAIPYYMQANLEAMRYWARDRYRRGIVPDATEFNQETADHYALQMQLEVEERELMAFDTPAPPEKLSDPKKFRTWSEAFETYLSRLVGVNGTPLSYVVRVDAVVPVGTVFTSDREALIATAPLAGAAFESDNHRVYAILKNLVLEGPGGTWIYDHQRAQNGRGAYRGMYEHYMGDGNMHAMIQDAYHRIESAKYDGKNRAMTFENYVSIHRKAHNDLDNWKEPVNPSKKVRDLITGITSSDTRLGAAITYVQNDPLCRFNFDEAVRVLSQAVGLPVNSLPFGPRQVSAAKQYSNRKGAPTANNEYDGKSGALSVSDLTRYYPDEEWHALPKEDKIVILQARGTYRGGKAGAGDEKKPPTSGVKRSVSAVQTATEAEEEEPSSEETVQAAGNQFGRHAHKKLAKRGGGPAM